MFFRRSRHNPILKPDPENFWEAAATFNACPVLKDKKIFLLYRTLSLPHYHSSAGVKMAISDIGLAESRDGVHFGNRRRLVVPEESWEKFGCEDPRVVKFGNRYYIFYTALSTFPFSAQGIKVGLAVSKDLETIERKSLVTPFNAKAMSLFPQKIGGEPWAILTVNTDRPPAKMCVVPLKKLANLESPEWWQEWYRHHEEYVLPLARRGEDQVEVGTPPLATKAGWLIIYSYIKNYFSDRKLFGVEAALLDRRDPRKILAHTTVPLMIPEEYYERVGLAPEIVFPTGAVVRGGNLNLYYGAADTTVGVATVKLSSLLKFITASPESPVKLARAAANPIIAPRAEHPWESLAAFNPAALDLGGTVHLLYRAMSADHTSTLGYAASADGLKITTRSDQPVYVPRAPFEGKKVPGGNSGCEDPRLTKLGERIYLTYTAYNSAEPPRVAISSITVKDFSAGKFNWSLPILVSPPDLDDKDAFVFPAKLGGKYLVVHRHGNTIDYSLVANLRVGLSHWLEENRWIKPRPGWWDSQKVGIAAPALKTKAGWLLLYHGVGDDNAYRVGAVLLDLKNPLKVLGRTDKPLLEPEADYEKNGQVPNVVFPCGAVIRGNKLFVYYGGGDQVVGVATAPVDKLIKLLKEK